MAAGGFKEFVAGEVLDENEINDFLMQGVLVFAGTAARGSAITSPVEGQFAFLKDSDQLTYHDGSDWVELSTTPGAAVVSATTGSPTVGTVSSGGTTYNVYSFTGDGSITISEAGFAEIVFVGGGAGGGVGLAVANQSAGGGGGAGGYLEDTIYLSAGTATITVGAGGAGTTSLNTSGKPGGASKLGKVISVGGSGGGQFALTQLSGGSIGGSGSQGTNTGSVAYQGNIGGNGANDAGGGGGGASAAGGNATNDNGGDGGNGLASSITGTSVTRAGGGAATGASTAGTPGTGGGGTGGGGAGSANTGGGGGGGFASVNNGGAGGSGIVIVRVAV